MNSCEYEPIIDREDYGSTKWKWFFRGVVSASTILILCYLAAFSYLFLLTKQPERPSTQEVPYVQEIVCGPDKVVKEYIYAGCEPNQTK